MNTNYLLLASPGNKPPRKLPQGVFRWFGKWHSALSPLALWEIGRAIARQCLTFCSFGILPSPPAPLPKGEGRFSRCWLGKWRPSSVVLAAFLLAIAGCKAVDFYDNPMQAPLPPEWKPPREIEKVSLPAYRVEPPDILMIEMLKMVPRPPYRIEIYDVLQVRAVGTLIDQPLDGFFLVEGEGIVTLGPAYGSVRVAGMSVDEAAAAITTALKKVLNKPEVSVQLARTAGTAPVTGEYLIAPDGTVNLRQYGIVHVAGRTVTEIRADLQRHLSQYFDSPDVSVDVRQFNSKVFYVVTQGAGLGDNIRRVPVTGNDTVLDALSAVNGLSQVSSANIWIARPAPGDAEFEQIIPIDYAALTAGGSAATNYQILPGDRLVIAGDDMIAVNSWLTKVTAPVERLLGIASLGLTTVRTGETMGRAYNSTRSN